MTTPISSTNSSFYDPNAQVSSTVGCDPSNVTCGPAPAPPPESAPAATSSPLTLTGSAAAAQQLVTQLDAARRTPDCALEGKNAALSCAEVGVAAAAGALLSTTLVGAAVGVAATFVESIGCGKDLRAYYDCKLE